MTELIPVNFYKIMQSRSYTVLILGTDQKKFAIYTDPHVGHTIQMHLTEKQRPRPYTYDLINKIFKGFEIKILQVVIYDVQDTIYFAKLFLELTSEPCDKEVSINVGDQVLYSDLSPKNEAPLKDIEKNPQSSTRTKQILEIDARPSDCLTLALMNNIPLFCKQAVFEKAVALNE